MPTVTVNDLITASLRKIGVHPAGEAVEADEAQDALDELNRLLDAWSTQRRLVYRHVTTQTTLTPGTATYTIGIGGQINTTRPLAIREAFVRVGSLDFPVEIFYVEQYFNIGIKSIQTTWPSVLYYDPAYPLGTITLYPVPSATSILFLGMDMQFPPFALITDALSFPPGYADALIHALGKRLAPEYGRTLSQEFLDDWRRCEVSLAKVNHRPVQALTDPRLPGGQVTDPNWVQHGGFR